MKVKKLVKITLVCVSLISLAWIIYIFLKRAPNKSSTNIPPKPNLIQTYKSSLSISLKTTESQFKYVSSLPFLSVTKKTITEEYLNKVATFMGFTGASTKINDTQEGLTYFWGKNNATLFAYTKSSKFRYASGTSLTVLNKQLSDDAVKALAVTFLADSGILEPDSFSLGNVEFLKEESLNESFKISTKDNFSLYQINILPKSVDHEIISQTSTESTNYIQLTKDGNVYSFQLVVFDSVQKGPIQYTIKTYREIGDSVGSSVLISLDGEETPMESLPANFVKGITIDQIDIAYLLDSPSSTNLQPVYKLTGNATLSDSGVVRAILYLPALSGL